MINSYPEVCLLTKRQVLSSLRQAMRLGWNSHISLHGEINLSPANGRVRYCPVTCAVQIREARFVKMENAEDEVYADADLLPSSDWEATYIADHLGWASRRMRRVISTRRTMFNILGLPKNKL